MRKTSPLVLLPLLLALGGCASWTSTPYEAPVLDLPARWIPPALPAGIETTANWWQAFNDPALNTLVDEVLARNNDLAVAGLRLQQARLQAGLAFSNQLPSVSVRQTGNASRQLGQGDSITHAYGLTGGLSYEVDLWGSHLNTQTVLPGIFAGIEFFYTKGNTVAIAKTLDKLFIHVGFFPP